VRTVTADTATADAVTGARDLIALLAQARNAQGLTQAEVAAPLGWQKTRITNWETGGTFPSLLGLAKWSAVLGFRLVLVPVQQDGGEKP
jgi:transcriptional regulator with XRE-family HTH domain